MITVGELHQDYEKYISTWTMVRDVCNGENVEQYLIELNAHDKSGANVARNKAYRERAVFYEVPGYTLSGLVGLMFYQDPDVVLPPDLEYVKDNIDGNGLSIYQQAQDLAGDLLSVSRAGLYTSFPVESESVTQADIKSGNVFATTSLIKAENIWNWELRLSGSKMKLNEVHISQAGEDGEQEILQLVMSENVFTAQLWRKDEKEKKWAEYGPQMIPRAGNGQPFDEIPFCFVGGKNNSSSVDLPLMKSLTRISIAHYRNSADWEDNVWWNGQSQPWASGLSVDDVAVMRNANIYFGSRELIGVPAGEQLGIVTAPPNTIVRQAMIDKLDMMIGLGARFIRDGDVSKTATESKSNDTKSQSSLSVVAGNIEEAYRKSLLWCAQYMNVSADDVSFIPSKKYSVGGASAQEIQTVVASFIQGAIPASDYLAWAKRAELVDKEKTFEEFSEEIQLATSMPDMSGTNG